MDRGDSAVSARGTMPTGTNQSAITQWRPFANRYIPSLTASLTPTLEESIENISIQILNNGQRTRVKQEEQQAKRGARRTEEGRNHRDGNEGDQTTRIYLLNASTHTR